MHQQNGYPDQKTLKSLRPVTILSLTYLVLSALWILLSDSLAVRIAGSNTAMLQFIQQVKGLFFVILSAVLLFFLARKVYRDLGRSFLQKKSLEEKFFALNEAAREGIFDCNLSSGVAEINNKMLFFMPASSNHVAGFWQALHNRVHPKDLAHLKKEFSGMLRSRKCSWQSEYRLLGLDNRFYNVINSNYILRDLETGEPIRLIGTVLDISELRSLQAEQFEERLKNKQELARSILNAQETERNRWAEELHDNVCQLLTVAKMYLGQMEKRPESTEQLMPQATKLVAEAMKEIRQLSASIKPPSLEQSSLEDSLTRLAADINRVRDIRFDFGFTKLNERSLTKEQKLLAYRVVQEQLNNILKYADAKTVVITLIQESDKFHIEIKDDGKGFDPSNRKSGIGLRNIESRLQIHKGSMRIESAVGDGCRLLADFDLN